MRAAKHNFNEVFVYAAIIAVLLCWRVWSFASKKFGPAPVGRPQLSKR